MVSFRAFLACMPSKLKLHEIDIVYQEAFQLEGCIAFVCLAMFFV